MYRHLLFIQQPCLQHTHMYPDCTLTNSAKKRTSGSSRLSSAHSSRSSFCRGVPAPAEPAPCYVTIEQEAAVKKYIHIITLAAATRSASTLQFYYALHTSLAGAVSCSQHYPKICVSSTTKQLLAFSTRHQGVEQVWQACQDS